MSVVAAVAGALDPRIAAVGLLNGPVSFVGEGPWKGLPMGVIAPNLLDVGDLGHLAGLVAPGALAVAGGVEPDGEAAAEARLASGFAPARAVYECLKVPGRLAVTSEGRLGKILEGWDAAT
jgi:hypothetical protein